MRIKNANLHYYVFYRDWNAKNLKRVNILGYGFAEELAQRIKKDKIDSREKLKETLKRIFMYHYWSKSEYEVSVGDLFIDNAKAEDFVKIDVWYQIEYNLDLITDHIITEMQIKF